MGGVFMSRKWSWVALPSLTQGHSGSSLRKEQLPLSWLGWRGARGGDSSMGLGEKQARGCCGVRVRDCATLVRTGVEGWPYQPLSAGRAADHVISCAHPATTLQRRPSPIYCFANKATQVWAPIS